MGRPVLVVPKAVTMLPTLGEPALRLRAPALTMLQPAWPAPPQRDAAQPLFHQVSSALAGPPPWSGRIVSLGTLWSPTKSTCSPCPSWDLILTLV